MNKDLKKWAWDMQRTIDSAIERIDNDTLSDKDAAETATMLLQLDHEVRNDPEYHTDTAIPAISVALNELYDALNSRDTRMLQLDNDVFRQLLSFGEILITKEERAAQEASKTAEKKEGRTYIDFLPRMPHEQYLQLIENLKEIGAKYDPAVKQWYVDADWKPKEKDASVEGKREMTPEELDRALAEQAKLPIEQRKTLDLSGRTIENYVFKGNLDNISFENARFINCEFRMTNLSQINFRHAYIVGCRFPAAHFRNCNFDNAMFTKCVVESSGFYKSSFADVQMRDSRFSENIFHECNESPGLNGGYSYESEITGFDRKELKFTVKITQDSEIVDEFPCVLKVDPETLKVMDMDSGKLDRKTSLIFAAEMQDILKDEKKVSDLLKKEGIETMNTGTNMKQFKAVYYDNSERKEIFGASKEDVIDAVRQLKVNAGEKERCYIQEYDGQKYQQEGIYLIASGRDVTPIEIRLPYMRPETFKEVREEIKKMGVRFDGNKKVWYMERCDAESKMDMLQNYLNNHDDAIYLKLPRQITTDQFKEIIDQLKQDGARYNPDKKAWYITDRNDISKFSAYLPSGSIHEKLENNKRIAFNAENISGRDRQMEPGMKPRKQDEHIV